MPKYKNLSLQKYLDILASREPVPGGGSAAALTGALGAALISMVAQYSKGRSKSKSTEEKIKNTLRKSEKVRKRLLALVDLDSEAYLKIVKSKKASASVKKAALRKAQDVPSEVCHLCYSALQLAPFLVKNGNLYLLSDVQCACELLLSAFNSAIIFSRQETDQ